MSIDAGDVVKHLPSGEEWVVACLSYDGKSLYACGWPETKADVSDCLLMEKATDEFRLKALKSAAIGGDERGRAARYALEARKPSFQDVGIDQWAIDVNLSYSLIEEYRDCPNYKELAGYIVKLNDEIRHLKGNLVDAD